MSDRERVAVYIDGSNFYHYLKEVGFSKGDKFNFTTFIQHLVGNERLCISKRYYTGIFRNVDGKRRSQDLIKGQQKFLSKLEKEGFEIKRGKIMYDKGRIREKGTDVKIAIDLIIGAIDDIYDTAILVSSDTDLIPAIKYVKYKSKKIEYIGFSHTPSLGIQKHVNFSKLLSKEDIDKFKKAKLL